MIHDVVRYFTTMHLNTILTVAKFLFSGVAVSVFLEISKPLIRRLEARWGADAKKLTIALLSLMSATVALAGDIVNIGPQSLGLVTTHATTIMAFAVVLYHFGGSQTYGKVRKYLSDFQNYLSTGTLPSGFKPKS